MNKHKFLELVENPSGIRDKDTDILTELARNYPYSSLVRTMLAKARQGTPEAKESLSTAAMYIPDRRVLKAVMEGTISLKAASKEVEGNHSAQPSSEAEKQQPDLPTTQDEEKPVKLAPEGAEEAPQAAKGPLNVIDELQENLRKLREQREQYENSGSPAEQEQEEPAVTNIPLKHLPERLQEILENKKEQEIRDPKRREQINMIDSFIQNSSNIARKYRSLGDENQQQSDLTSSFSFTPPDLVTENLAQIMVRQGKTEKAIDIYEKLVLKYPQKKAYFATCIEKLKTSL